MKNARRGRHAEQLWGAMPNNCGTPCLTNAGCHAKQLWDAMPNNCGTPCRTTVGCHAEQLRDSMPNDCGMPCRTTVRRHAEWIGIDGICQLVVGDGTAGSLVDGWCVQRINCQLTLLQFRIATSPFDFPYLTKHICQQVRMI